MNENFHVSYEPITLGYKVKINAKLGSKNLYFEDFSYVITADAMQDVYLKAVAYWEFHLGVGRLEHSRSRCPKDVETDMRLHSLMFPNWVYLPPPFKHSLVPAQDTMREPEPWLYELLCDIDVARFKVYGRDFLKKYVWTGNKFADQRKEVEPIPSLQLICLRGLSIANYMGRTNEGDAAQPARMNLYPTKIPRLIGKYGGNTHLGLKDRTAISALNHGILLLHSVMDTVRFFGTLNFTYDTSQFNTISFPHASSAGIRAPSTTLHDIQSPFFKIKIVTNGTKGCQAPYAFNAANRYILAVKQSESFIPSPQRLCKVALKAETRDLMWKMGPDRVKAEMKCREFFIPHFTNFLIATVVFGYRCMIERGNTIKIGFKWWNGGGHTLATELGYPRKDIIYSTGDVAGQDYSTPHYMLLIFGYTTLLYINKNSPDYSLFKKLLFGAIDELVAKPVNFFANMWRVVVGTMPSGHFVTSHANSYILALTFWSYVYLVHRRNPLYDIVRKRRNKNGHAEYFINPKYFIRFVVYGDNHIVAVSRNIVHIVNYVGFARFAKDIGFTMHEVEEDVPLISVPDCGGCLKVRGVCFLKRYFIEVDTAKGKYIVPYKTYVDGAVKIVFGNTERRNVVDLMVALIGMAWDYQGTNIAVHNIILQIYNKAALEYHKANKTIADFYDEAMKDEKRAETVRKLARKAQITEQEILQFPRQKELMMRHSYDKKRFMFRRVPDPNKFVVVDDLEGDTYENHFPCN